MLEKFVVGAIAAFIVAVIPEVYKLFKRRNNQTTNNADYEQPKDITYSTSPQPTSTTAVEETTPHKKGIRSYAVFAIIAILLALNVYQFTQIQRLSTQLEEQTEIISQQNAEITLHKKNATVYENRYTEIKDKAEFIDNNIVFVIDGDDVHYYTYDEMMMFFAEYEFTYWAYNIENAIYLGYTPMTLSSVLTLSKILQLK